MFTDWLSPSAGASLAGPNVDWSDPANITANDDAYASAVMAGFPVAANADWLAASGFAANVPADATITGVELRVRALKTGEANLSLATLQLDGVIGDTENWLQDLTDAETVYTIGPSRFGMELTPAIVNDPLFGPAIKSSSTAGGTAFVDHIEMRVHFQPRSSLGLLGAG